MVQAVQDVGGSAGACIQHRHHRAVALTWVEKEKRREGKVRWLGCFEMVTEKGKRREGEVKRRSCFDMVIEKMNGGKKRRRG